MTSRSLGIPWLDAVLEFALPPLCLGCGSYTDSETAICEHCRRKIETYVEPFCLTCKQQLFETTECPNCKRDSWLLFAYGNYIDPLQEVIIHFKFRGITHIGAYFADTLAEQFGERIHRLEPTYLVPIPLYPLREMVRGYNQAEVFAEELSLRLDIPVATDFLKRTKRRKEQARLSEHERAANIKGAFEATADADPGETVILVDDVVTSGMTVSEARRVLMEAGFQVPAAISIAHGL